MHLNVVSGTRLFRSGSDRVRNDKGRMAKCEVRICQTDSYPKKVNAVIKSKAASTKYSFRGVYSYAARSIVHYFLFSFTIILIYTFIYRLQF